MHHSSKADQQLIEENAKARRQLEQSHLLLSNLARLVPGVIYQYRLYPDGRSAFPYSSPGINDIYEVTPEEVREDATPVFGRLHPDDLDDVANAIRESARSLQTFYCEFRVILPRQGLRWRWSQAQPERTEDGGTLWHGIILDVTERKQTESALIESDYFFRESQRAAMVGSYRTDFVKGVWESSDVLDQIFGIDRAFSRTVQEWMNLVHPDDAEMMRQYLQEEVIKEGKLFNREYRIVRKADGETRWVRGLGRVTLDDQGNAVSLIGTIQDITELKSTEEALQESIGRYRGLFDQANEGLLIMTPDGHLSEVNRAFAEMHGYEMDELLRINIRDLDALKDRALEDRADIIHRIQNGEVVRFEVDHYHKDGHIFPLSVTTSLINLGGQPFWLAFHQDISARRKAEAEKATLEAQLQQAQKMESVGRLAGGVAHDFNNMLGVILGYAELALKQAGPGHPLHASLTEIFQAATRSANLTRQLLAFARKQTITPRVLNLNDVVAGMLTMLQRLIGEDINLKWQPAADLWLVKLDPSQIDQILTNLLVNARDALSGGGKVTVETGNTTFDEGFCANHTGFVPGEFVRLDVSDCGFGMDKDTLSHLFEPFFTTKQMGNGSGLGLATVYGIVKQNDGFINVYSEPGEGTRFSIYLPRHSGKAEQTRTHEPEAAAVRGQETILLVEDEPSILELATILLERLGYTVLKAQTPEEAIDLATRHSEPIHLLLTDVIMPEMNGLDLAKNLLTLYPHLKSLFMSGYTADVIARHGVLDPGVSFVQKPFSNQELAAKVRETLDLE